MSLKRERPETDDFVITKYLVLKEKVESFSRHPYNFFFGIFLRFRTFKAFFFPTNNLLFFSTQGFCPPPPLADMSVKDVIFLDGFPY